MPSPAHLEPSELGTKEYWDNYYQEDLSPSTPSSTASLDGWFADVRASEKIVKFLSDPSRRLNRDSTSFLDLGTGNGEMLFLLREQGGFTGRMLGVDYSVPSVELARRMADAKHFHRGGTRGMDFEVWDIIRDQPLPEWKDGFDVVLDKGTFDAVSLSDEKDERGNRICGQYRAKIEPLVAAGGLLVVTSCNWTESEIKTWLEKDDSRFNTEATISYPSFSFGGQTGQSVSTVCFTKSN